MRKLQWLSVCLATIGVGVLTFDYGRLPWVALAVDLFKSSRTINNGVAQGK